MTEENQNVTEDVTEGEARTVVLQELFDEQDATMFAARGVRAERAGCSRLPSGRRDCLGDFELCLEAKKAFRQSPSYKNS